jgi:signal transduction histidine kinase
VRRVRERLRHPHTTIRWRLTLLYGGMFLICGAALLAVTYGLVSHAVSAGGVVAFGPGPATPAQSLTSPFSAGATVQKSSPSGPTEQRFPDGSSIQLHALPQSTLVIKGKEVKIPPNLSNLLGSATGRQAVRFVGRQQQIADLHQLEIESAIALAIMAIISALLGWYVAGRVLGPLRTITATAQQISEANLHRRLALPGPPDELRTLADTIDNLLARLESAFEAQRRFVANASHELRTPLTAVRALLEMVISDPRATVETFRETCREALEESEQQEQLIDALLALAQGQRGLDHREPTDLASVTDETIKALAPEADERHLHVEQTLAPATIYGDRRLIARLVSNLLQNAIRHNVPDGEIQIRVGAFGGRASLTIANTGPVVPADQVVRLLQPFQRLATDRLGHHDGFGLGLSIVAAIASAHEARLDIRPGEHGGLHIEVTFPAAARGLEPSVADPRPMPEPTAA